MMARLTCHVTIRSGGQTGVDRAALDFAIANAIPYAGWCPRGGWAEDLMTPPGLLAKYPGLAETPSAQPEQRTAWNVRDSRATLVLTDDPDLDTSHGTRFTILCAELIFLRPFHIVNLASAEAADLAAQWLVTLMASSGDDTFVVNVAGPRESDAPGIDARTLAVLPRILRPASGLRDVRDDAHHRD
jgi:hypothetical protein